MYTFLTSTTLLRKVSVCERKIFIWLKLLWSGLFWMALEMDMDCILSETCNPVLLQEKSSLIYSECWETQHLHETFSPSLHIRPCFVCSEIQPFLVSLSTGLYSGWIGSDGKREFVLLDEVGEKWHTWYLTVSDASTTTFICTMYKILSPVQIIGVRYIYNNFYSWCDKLRGGGSEQLYSIVREAIT